MPILEDAEKLLKKVTKTVRKEMAREERLGRIIQSREASDRGVSFKEAVFWVLPEAIDEATDGGDLTPKSWSKFYVSF